MRPGLFNNWVWAIVVITWIIAIEVIVARAILF